MLRLEVLESRRLLAGEQLIHAIPNPSSAPQEYAEFGAQVATDGVRGIVSAPSAAMGGFGEAGVAYLYDLQAGGEAITLANPTPGYYEHFGYSVDVDGPLAVVGSPENGPGSVYIYDATNGNLLRTLSNPHVSKSGGFGSSVAISGTTLVVGLASASTAYVYDASSGTLLQTIVDPAPSSGDQFGSAVAISGTQVLIADYRQSVGIDSRVGNAHLFDAGTGNLLKTFANPTPAQSDEFGDAIAIDGNTVVIGAWGDDTGGANAGAAYVFDASTGALVHTLSSPTPAASEYFGRAVSTASGKVFAGAPSQTSATLPGSVYVFDAASGAYRATLSDPSPANGERFGSAVSASDTRTLVGAVYSAVDGLAAGQAFVFAADGQLQRTLDSPVPGTDEYFGGSVSISGDIAVAGSYNGMAAVYEFSSGNLLYQLTSPEPAIGRLYGEAVAISGNVLAVGDDGADNFRGAVYIYDVTNGQLVRTLRETGGQADDQFGSSLALDGNTLAVSQGGSVGNLPVLVYNSTTGNLLQTLADPGDGADAGLTGFGDTLAIDGNLLLVGAPYTDQGATDAGAAYLFNATTGQLLHTLANPTPGGFDWFGSSVAILGNRAIVGAHLDDTQASNAGAAYVFDTTTGALVTTLLEPAATAETDDQFGAAVGLSDKSIYVGATFDDSGGGIWGGAVHVFDAATGSYQQRLTYPNPAHNDFFGDNVAVDGHRLVVGADEVDGPTLNRGAICLFAAPAVVVETGGPLSVAENGSPAQETATFTVTLSAPPASDVRIAVSSNDTSELTVAPATLTFNAANYNLPQTVTVTGVVDNVVDATQDVAVVVAVDAANSDVAYGAVPLQNVPVSVLDVPVKLTVSGPTGTSDPLATFTFEEVAGATSYNLWLIDDANPATVVYSKSDIAGSPFTLPSGRELPEGSYRYFLSANNAVGYSQWSGPHDFAVGKAATEPPAPTAATSTTETSSPGQPTISWPAADRAATYEVYLINLDTGAAAASVRGLTTTSWTPPSPLPDAKYRVYVRAWNALGTSGFGAPLDFAVGTPLTAPAATTVTSVSGNPPTIQWPAADRASSYELYLINLTSGAVAASVRGLTGTSYAHGSALPDADYRIYVRAWNRVGTSGFGAPHDFTIGTPLVAPPVPTGLTATDTNTARPTLQWNAVAGASSYSIWLVNLTTGALVSNASSLPTNSFTPAFNLDSGNYGYYVKAHNSAGSSAFSPRHDFAVAVPPVAEMRGLSDDDREGADAEAFDQVFAELA